MCYMTAVWTDMSNHRVLTTRYLSTYLPCLSTCYTKGSIIHKRTLALTALSALVAFLVVAINPAMLRVDMFVLHGR